MKKTLTFLSVLLLLITNSLMAQNQTNTQFPNPGFEVWSDHSGDNVPVHWHTFDEISCGLLIGCGTARTNHHNQKSGSGNVHSGTYAIELYCKSVLGKKANGALSTGRTRVGDTEAGSASNYNYATTESGYVNGYKFYWDFVGCPDSVSFYYKTNYSSSDRPYLKVFTVTDLPFYDKANGVLSPTNYIVGSADMTTLQQSSSWARAKYKVTYTHSYNTDNNYSTITRPNYMLASFSTSTVAGSGAANDKLTLDDLFCIYDKGLATLTIDGTANNDAKNYFNGQEFLTHEPTRTYDASGNPSFNNSGSATWNYPDCVSASSIPQIAATPNSKLITEFQVTQASASNGYKATIYVKHNDNSTFYYYIQFKVNPTLTLASNNNQSVCAGMAISAISVTFENCNIPTAANVTELPSGVSYDRSSRKISGTPSTAGTYQYTFTVSNNDGCTATATGTITVNGAPTVTLSSNKDQTVCAGTAISAISVSCSNGNPSVTGLPSGVSYSASTRAISGTPTTPGTYSYTMTVESNNGCGTATATGTITVNGADAGTVNVSGTTTICNGGSGTTLTASTTGSTGTVTYAWSPADGLNTTSGATVTANPTVTTTYTVTATATDGSCTATATKQVTVTVNNPVAGTVNVSGTTTICKGGSGTTLTASTTGSTGTVTYAWSPATGLNTTSGATVTANPTTTTTYTVTATATDGSCTATATKQVTVTVNNPVAGTVNVSGTTTICKGGSGTTLTASTTGSTGTVTYAWSPATGLNTTSGATVTANPTTTTTYTVTATATDGSCTATATKEITITVNAPAVTLADMSRQVVCNGSAFNISATPTGTPNGTVSYTWSGPNGFSSTEQNIQINNISAINAGEYFVTATATVGSCTATSTKNFTLMVNAPSIALQNMNPQSLCAGDNLHLAATTIGTPVGVVSYAWTGPAGFTGSGEDVYRNNMTSDYAGYYTVTATATKNLYETVCTATATKEVQVTVTTPVAGTVNVSGTTTICNGGSGTTLTASTTGNTGTMSYAWSPATGLSATTGTQVTANPTTTTTYTVTATATMGTCTATTTKPITITVNTASVGTITLGNQEVTICKNNGRAMLSVSCSNGSGERTYAWSPADGLSSTSDYMTYASPQTTTTYTVTITATNTVNNVVCTATETREFTVTVNAPAVTLGDIPTQSICEGSTLNLSATPSGTTTGTVSYSWTGPNSFTSTQQNPRITNVTSVNAGTYYVTATATNVVNDVTCTVTSSKHASVQVQPLPYITEPSNKNQTVCAGNAINSITFSHGTGTLSVSNLPAGLNFNSTIGLITGTPTESGIYTVTLTNDCGTATVSGTITVNAPAVTLADMSQQVVCNGSAFNASATLTGTPVGTATYAWSGPNGFSSNEQNIQINNVSAVNAGTYNVTATAMVGTCAKTSVKSFTLVVNAPTIALQNMNPQTLCAGEDLHLAAAISGTPVGTVSYAWTGPAGFTGTGAEVTRYNMTSDYAGYYTVTATSTQNLYGTACTATATKEVQVIVNAPVAGTVNVTSNAPGGNNTICKGSGTTITATTTGNTGTMTYAWSPSTGLDATSGRQVTASPNTTTTYTVTATATVGTCTATTTKQITITVNNPVAGTVNVTGNTTVCKGSSTTLTASTSGNTGTMSYAWSPATGLNTTTGTQVTATPTATTTYTVTGTATVGTCTATATKQVTVTVNELPAVSISGNTSFCQGVTETLTATAGYNNYNWSTNSTNQSIDVTSSGTYSVTVTDANGCQNNTSVTVTTLSVPTAPTATTENNTSCTSPNGSITVTNPVGAGYTYSIGGDFQSAATFSNISAGTYTLTVKNTNGCTSTSPVEVEAIGNSVNATASANTPCAGGTIQLTGTSTTEGVSFAWTGPNGYTSAQQNPQISNATSDNAGTYTLTVTETATNCTKTASVNVTVNALPTVTISGATTICAGTSANLTAQGANDYVWSNGQEGAEVSIAEAGSVTVTGTDANGCSNTANVTITINTPYVALNAMTDVVACEGDNVTLSASVAGANGPMTFVWTGPNGYRISNQIIHLNGITTAQSGQYTVVVTTTRTVNDLTCTATDSKSVNVTVNALPTITISGETTICAGTSANLTAQGANNYVWSNGQEGAEVSIAEAGSVTVTGTDVNNCTSTASVTITVNEPSVALNAMTDVDVCEGGNVTLNAVLNGTATGDVTYAWTGPNSYTSAQQNPQLNGVTTAQNGQYTVVATATNEVNGVTCTATDSKTVNVTVNALPAVPVLVAVNNTSCASPNGSITVTSPTGANYEYAINGGAYQTSTAFENLDASSYTVTVKDVNTGCTNENSTRITTQGSTLEVEVSVNEVCAGGTAEFQSTLTNATGDVTYAWSGPAGFTSSDENPTISNLQSGNAGTYTLQVTETATSCRVSATTTLIVNEPTTGDTTAIACVSFDWYEHTGLTTSGDYTHVFEGGNANGCDSVVTLHLTINNPTAGDTTAVECVSFDWYEHTGLTESGDYTHVFEGGNANGCDSTVTLHLTINQPTMGDTTAVECDSFDWYEHTGLTESGDYTHVFEGGNANGCDSTVTLHLTINTTPVVTIEGETSIITGNSATLTASGADTYLWSTEETTASITVSPTTNTTYSVVGTSNNCSSKPVSITVNVNDCIPGYGDTTAVACSEFTWYGTTYTASTETATHVFEGVMPDGCDSIVTLHLTINQPVENSFYATACVTYTWNELTYEASGDYTQTFTAANGCDSIVTLHLTIDQPVENSFDVTACETYSWNGQTYEESGNYTQTFTAANGCDSVVTLYLTIHQPVENSFEATACETYTWNEETYNESGDYTQTFTASNNCDSVVTLHLTINQPVENSFEAIACETYAWNNQIYEVSGDYTQTFTAANGCDSVVTLHLTINQPVENSFYATACENYTWNEQTYNESGDYMQTFSAANGCDSVVTLHLTIDQPVENSFDATACETYTWNGQTYEESGNYTQTFTAANGCDSVVTLYLTIHQPVENSFEATACETYTWNEETYNESGDYTQTFTASNNCDSVVTLHLTINQPVENSFEVTTCGTYAWNDQIYEVSGDYTQTFTAANGCDSVVTLHLTINQLVEHSFYATACVTYTWNEQTYNESGDYTQSFTAANGCDSVVTLHLTIDQPVENSFEATACETYTWNGWTYDESGNYTQTLTAANGCDSVVTLHLTINQPVENSFEATACETYAWNDQTYNESGNYTQTFTAANGCDSIVTLHLTINQPVENAIEATSCGTYTWNGQIYEASGDYTQTFTAANGCDSVVTLHLTIDQPVENSFEATACETYTWNGQTYDESGDYTQTLTAANGCDSVVTLHLTINKSTTGVDVHEACDHFTWIDGVRYTENNNTATYVLTNAAGCDSVVTLNLTIKNSLSSIDEQVACNEYTWINGITYTESTNEPVFTLTSENGCDSVVTLHLTINKSTEGIDEHEACGEYTWIDGITYTESTNTATYTLTNAAGCDSIVTLHLTINTEIHNNLTVHGCDSYEWDGDVYSTSGEYTKSYPLPNGCDSIVTIDLTITPTYLIEIKDTICEGSLYARYNFMETEAGDYTQNLQTASGCDSVVVLHLATKACSSDCGADLQDIDGNTYGTKAVNSLCWMTSNLRTTRYSDATPIPVAIVYSYPYDPNNTANAETYGRLYDWASASRNAAPTRSPEVQGACPYGWRLPSQEEFAQWSAAFTMDQIRSTTNWLIENGNNASGLNMQPGGFYNSTTQRCEELHGKAYFYTSDYYSGSEDVVHMRAECGCWELMFIRDHNLNDAYSVRCVKAIE